ncbi:MAG TPA: threonine/serine dehydratase [Pyrinomonadaceae bacterium]|jgi:threonine dehydratase|nr:threonine/serine dehydratase [Pyrinomonadaceae bacterium]
MLTFQLIQEAAARIAGRVHHTPVMTSRAFDETAGKQVFFKCENLQRVGAFKFRGATNRIQSLTDDEKRRGVIAISSGNHAQAVALAAREAGVRAVVAIPADAPKMKVAATRDYGADIRFFDRLTVDREAFGREIAEREDLVMVPPYDDYLIMAGQGTCGLELLQEVPDLDCVLTPCSGGGLFAGVSTAARALNPDIRCFAVEPETANDTQKSVAAGERVRIPPPPTIADGLRVQSPGVLTFPITRQNVDAVLTVSDNEMMETIRFLLLRLKIVVEPSGAAAAAAVFFGKLPAEVKRVGVILSGGNMDADVLVRVLTPEGEQ